MSVSPVVNGSQGNRPVMDAEIHAIQIKVSKRLRWSIFMQRKKCTGNPPKNLQEVSLADFRWPGLMDLQSELGDERKQS